MTSRQRVRAAIEHKKPDRVPAAFEAVNSVIERLLRHYGFSRFDQLAERYEIDIMQVSADYCGPPLPVTSDAQGRRIEHSPWGFQVTAHEMGAETYGSISCYPLNGAQTIAEVDAYPWPNPDWFDYESVKRQCDRHEDKAIIFGHEGPFQLASALMNMEELFILMLEAPEVAGHIFNRMVAFELEYYERAFEAADGRIDILRPHDDYGTQISLLFSIDAWREFFKENTQKLVCLAHRYGAFYQQHSCGAVAPLIPELIDCGVDVLEPLQKLPGLEPETLYRDYGGKIAFHGGIDTQLLLPFSTARQVAEETRRYISALGKSGGYILMASQAFEHDVPIENIEALYAVER